MGPTQDCHALTSALARVAEILRWPDERLYALVETTSRWSVAQHVQHVLLALERFLEAIQTLEQGGNGVQPRRTARLAARFILAARWIPRGRAQSPESVRPDAIPNRARLRADCESLEASFRQVALRARALQRVSGTLPHPRLGPLTAVRWLRFARVHTAHHLAIVADIDRTRVAGEPMTDPLAPLGESP